ncbi:hypothetical protein HPB52_000100 [Rhipicephalus sanguineus]|uniref:Uncharacterized protein n=1 Tax=Rhipicephalus sanguineus TaxID=34632 RepID=A0A9D4SVS6_RHISA|nr:hypothetical protein HPB52_000100 [Rhipicephalus sanguineus]
MLPAIQASVLSASREGRTVTLRFEAQSPRSKYPGSGYASRCGRPAPVHCSADSADASAT